MKLQELSRRLIGILSANPDAGEADVVISAGGRDFPDVLLGIGSQPKLMPGKTEIQVTKICLMPAVNADRKLDEPPIDWDERVREIQVQILKDVQGLLTTTPLDEPSWVWVKFHRTLEQRLPGLIRAMERKEAE